ncbi:MAG: hypothetical protein BWK76_27040 [Desulfobulbaceae bacterium A2]|nr:MAG: hypothetical protein BWK76_27040 [Desulfobulbaceae bacterium A2]
MKPVVTTKTIETPYRSRRTLVAVAFAMLLSAGISAPARAGDPGATIIGGVIGAGIGQALGHNTEATLVGAATGALLAHSVTQPAPPPRWGHAPHHGYYRHHGPPVVIYAPPPPRYHWHHWHYRHHHW